MLTMTTPNSTRVALTTSMLAMFIACAAIPNPVLGQNCSPGPTCAAAGQRVQAYVAQIQSRIGGAGIATAAHLNYCVMMVAAELNRACADELRAAGHNECADLADRQKDEFLNNARVSEDIVRRSTSGPMPNLCGW